MCLTLRFVQCRASETRGCLVQTEIYNISSPIKLEEGTHSFGTLDTGSVCLTFVVTNVVILT